MRCRLQGLGHHNRDGLTEEGHLARIERKADAGEAVDHPNDVAVLECRRGVDPFDGAAGDSAAHESRIQNVGDWIVRRVAGRPGDLLPSVDPRNGLAGHRRGCLNGMRHIVAVESQSLAE